MMKLGSIAIRLCVAAGLVSMTAVTPSAADPVKRGLQGAIGGAVIGGIVGGGKGAGRGAAIGAAVGIIGGAMEDGDRRHYRREEYRRRQYSSGYAHTSPLVRNIQASLTRLGYHPGPIDGVMGRQTAMAIGIYQDEHGLLVTKRASSALLHHIRRNGG